MTAQEQYKQLVEQKISWGAESRLPTRLVKYAIWFVRQRLFWRQHRGETFQYFSPEAIKAACSEKVEAWQL